LVICGGKVPEVPLMVTFAGPGTAVVLAVKVTTLVDVVGLVAKVAVTPDGRPETDNVTLPLKPPEGVTLMVLAPLPPWLIVKLVGDEESEKLGTVAGGNTQLFAALENSNWIVYVVPLTRYEPCCALQMSPTSPFALSYHARGAANVVASPTSASVIASANS